ncbi:carbohydrate kinase family protein [Lyngbya confervoides]|uniref:Carbohydrate kinase n=1 Tax=Lyngbya confervoides BDU141951 TaxID=1574623 RepID=A0ABD4SYY5_9CYAN|nr:carbohydrate kinase [Lyngbya confervoides]MCM1981488.1 carbohydrate kinase [Lyngbya confervoides BDU141951]
MGQVICLGEALIDRLATESGAAPSALRAWHDFPGGAPANVACALQRLGTPSAFLGCIGTDSAGNHLVSVLEHYGVNLQGLQRHQTYPTRQVYVTHSPEGDRQFLGFGAFREFADQQFQASRVPRQILEAADYLVLGTLMFASPSGRQSSLDLLATARQQGVECFLDVNWRPMFWSQPASAIAILQTLLPQVDYLKLSSEEADWLWGSQDPGSMAADLPHLQGVFVTAGSQGCRYWLQGNTGSMPAFPVSCVDSTGAGDGFVAGCLHRLSQLQTSLVDNPQQAEDLVRYASAVGALTTLQLGAIADHPTAADVAQFLSAQPPGHRDRPMDR